LARPGLAGDIARELLAAHDDRLAAQRKAALGVLGEQAIEGGTLDYLDEEGLAEARPAVAAMRSADLDVYEAKRLSDYEKAMRAEVADDWSIPEAMKADRIAEKLALRRAEMAMFRETVESVDPFDDVPAARKARQEAYEQARAAQYIEEQKSMTQIGQEAHDFVEAFKARVLAGERADARNGLRGAKP
jgi:hypothetical protein